MRDTSTYSRYAYVASRPSRGHHICVVDHPVIGRAPCRDTGTVPRSPMVLELAHAENSTEDASESVHPVYQTLPGDPTVDTCRSGILTLRVDE